MEESINCHPNKIGTRIEGKKESIEDYTIRTLP